MGVCQVWVDAVGFFFLGNAKSTSLCFNIHLALEGLQDTTLTGQNNTNYNYPPYFHCARLMAAQLS